MKIELKYCSTADAIFFAKGHFVMEDNASEVMDNYERSIMGFPVLRNSSFTVQLSPI